MTNCEVIAMNIAIVDDEPVFLKQLHNRLREMKLPDCEIHEFTSGRDLLSFYVKGMYEVIILDVEMPDLTGLQTAERIRQIDGSVIISFLTNYAEFAVKGYDVGAFRYILKNQPDYVYTKQLNSIIAECQQRFRTFTFNNKNLSFKFRLTDILYFEGHRRKVSLFTVNGELEYGGDFSTVCGELLKYNFAIINRGILVNLDHIQNITKYDIILSNGRKIPIGKTYKDENEKADEHSKEGFYGTGGSCAGGSYHISSECLLPLVRTTCRARRAEKLCKQEIIGNCVLQKGGMKWLRIRF